MIPLLVLPTGQKIRFEETSRDVIHSFWVPELLFKRDVFPGNVRNVFEVTLDTRGRVRRPLRRALRHVPLVDALRAAWWSRRRSTTSSSRPSAAAQSTHAMALSAPSASSRSR